jgi:hypothetical protein
MNAEAAENCQIFKKFVSGFERSVTLSRVARAAHQTVIITAGVLCTCMQFQHSSLYRFGSSVDLQNLVKI